jgi:hypothetical protein
VQADAERAAAANNAAARAVAGSGADAAKDEAALRSARASIGIAADEAELTGVVPLEAQEYWWRERHKPRKPKFFNKVHTGEIWLLARPCVLVCAFVSLHYLRFVPMRGV